MEFLKFLGEDFDSLNREQQSTIMRLLQDMPFLAEDKSKNLIVLQFNLLVDYAAWRDEQDGEQQPE